MPDWSKSLPRDRTTIAVDPWHFAGIEKMAIAFKLSCDNWLDLDCGTFCARSIWTTWPSSCMAFEEQVLFIHAGGRLRTFMDVWTACISDTWVQEVVSQDFKLEFRSLFLFHLPQFLTCNLPVSPHRRNFRLSRHRFLTFSAFAWEFPFFQVYSRPLQRSILW